MSLISDPAVRIIATILGVVALARLTDIAIRVYRSTDHNESHEWSDE